MVECGEVYRKESEGYSEHERKRATSVILPQRIRRKQGERNNARQDIHLPYYERGGSSFQKKRGKVGQLGISTGSRGGGSWNLILLARHNLNYSRKSKIFRRNLS